MTTPNPWTVVPAADYERHMGPQGVDQLAPLSAIFEEVYAAAQPDRLLVLGCATGNGLEHVNPAVTKRIVGVDVNLQYLGVARQRFIGLGARLELVRFAADHGLGAGDNFFADCGSARYASRWLNEPAAARVSEVLAINSIGSMPRLRSALTTSTPRMLRGTRMAMVGCSSTGVAANDSR